MHEQLYEQLINADPESVAARAGCDYSPSTAQYTVKFLNTDYLVDPENKCIIYAEQGQGDDSAEGGDGDDYKVGFLHQLCILAYLLNASDEPLSGKLVTPETLPGGQFFFRPPHELPKKQLETAFGTDPQRLITAAEVLGATQCEFGDASVSFSALPNVPVCFIVWKADDEFPARASILYDSTANQQLPLDAIWSATNIAAKLITK